MRISKADELKNSIIKADITDLYDNIIAYRAMKRFITSHIELPRNVRYIHLIFDNGDNFRLWYLDGDNTKELIPIIKFVTENPLGDDPHILSSFNEYFNDKRYKAITEAMHVVWYALYNPSDEEMKQMKI